jgi:hypothetical protein
VLSGQSPAALLLVTISRHLAAAWRHAASTDGHSAIFRDRLANSTQTSAHQLHTCLVHGSRWLMELAATRQTCPQLMSPIWSPVY